MAEQQIRLPEDQMNQYIKFRQEEERCIENINRATVQLDTELRNRRSKYITRQEIAKLPKDVPVYSSVGKAFLLDSVPTTLEKLRTDLGKCDEKILLIKKTGIYILGQQDDVRNQIDELLAPYIKKVNIQLIASNFILSKALIEKTQRISTPMRAIIFCFAVILNFILSMQLSFNLCYKNKRKQHKYIKNELRNMLLAGAP